ncbi:FtsX-like permease family protein [Streptomyces sp. NPDC005811]|uniref:ABC transporter permease n=1 Tax=Streptomyces sp. NPDC005811 TaxID=3154565 RepID=UPI0033E7A434
MSALGRFVRAGAARRRVQSLVVGLATLLAVTSSVLGGALLVASDAPFDQAFARQHGAHLIAQFAAGRVTEARLLDTARADGVAAAAGPFPVVSAAPSLEGMTLPPLTVVGRADPDGPVDALALTGGRWVRAPGEIVLAAGDGPPVRLGLELEFPELPGSPTLTVVGTARSVGRSADAWVVPSQVAALTATGRAADEQMLYRFAGAGGAAEVARGRAAVTAGLPSGSLAGVRSWLAVKKEATRDTALFVPFLVAFGVLGLFMSVLVVGSVVAGAVGTGLRRIGVLKAVGCTPAQVVRAYAAQALLPAAAATVVGLVAGHLLAVPLLADTAQVYGSAGLGVTVWTDVVVAGGMLGLVALTAAAAAWRAGRLRSVDALAVGRAPTAGRGRRAAALAARLPLPRPVGLGLARPFARPARTAATAAAVVFGTAAVTFGVGLSTTLGEVVAARNHNAADVTVGAQGPAARGPGAPAVSAETAAAVTRAVAAQPGTRRQYGTALTEAAVAGASGGVPVLAYDGDASWGGFRMVAGRWLRAEGEAVAATPFLTAAGAGVGDTVTLTVRGTAVRVRIVGEVLDTTEDGMRVFTDVSTLRAADPGLTVSSWAVELKPGTDADAYASALDGELEPLGLDATSATYVNGSDMARVMDAMTALLTLMLVCVAGLGVLGAVVLDTHERIRELGVHKALGMTPRQTVVLVLASVVPAGLVGAAVGVPLGMSVHGVVTRAMGRSAGLRLPESVLSVYGAPLLALLALAGTAVAVLGALLPAGWAARVRTATALRTE